MKFSHAQIKEQLNKQGFDIVPIAPELVSDVRLWPVPPADILRSCRSSMASLATLQRHFSGAGENRIESIYEVFRDAQDCPDTEALRELFNRCGSDKAVFHDYHLAYGGLLQGRRGEPLDLLEIGLGTNNVDVPSNMGRNACPGASVRAFRDWAGRASIVGADVDERILFSEERIETHFIDQLDQASIRRFADRMAGRTFDLIIDDGLHTPEANINTLFLSLSLLKAGGAIVVEDIGEEDFPFWDMVFMALETRYRCRFVRAKQACLAIIQKRTSG